MLQTDTTRRQAIATTIAGLVSVTVSPGQTPGIPSSPSPKKSAKIADPSISLAPDAITGPMIGHTSDRETILWIRPAKPGIVTLSIRPALGGSETLRTGEALAENDLCVAIRVENLSPSTEYTYSFSQSGTRLGGGTFRTWPAKGSPAKVTLALGSCALTESSAVWSLMEQSGCEAILLMGDTPYIDSYELEKVRRHHREFLHIPELKPLIAKLPVWGTWDDHDFGLNSHLGNADPTGKKSTRKAFVEYRALANHGENDAGIYTTFRAGSIQVWLLDPRWFSMTEKSPVDGSLPTCFGAAQWKWLLAGLKGSDASFKLLAMGEIWQDKGNRETDDMGTFPHEREALFDFIKKEKISGVMLFGGDIHCSRHLCTKGRVGYDIHEFVSSPIHDRVIPSLNIPHPDLVWGQPVPRTFLRVTADDTATPATLVATFLSVDGTKLHEVALTSDQLRSS